MSVKEFLQKHGIYTLNEAAHILNIKADTLKKQCQAGKHNAVRVGRLWLIKLDK